MIMKQLRILFALTAIAVATFASHAQCRSFAKNKCLHNLLPYTFNETFNAAQLAPGEEAEVDLTFYSGQEYRLMVCAHQILGEVNWKLMDATGQTLFESTPEQPKALFDFKVANTQQLKVHIDVPAKAGSNEMLQVGCVAILVGYKD
jgi:hypothetical protein